PAAARPGARQGTALRPGAARAEPDWRPGRAPPAGRGGERPLPAGTGRAAAGGTGLPLRPAAPARRRRRPPRGGGRLLRPEPPGPRRRARPAVGRAVAPGRPPPALAGPDPPRPGPARPGRRRLSRGPKA